MADIGWKDSFDDPAFTRRRQDYARAPGRTELFTPEMMVNGRSDVVGDDRVTVSGPIPAGGQLVRYDPEIIQVQVEGREDAGRTLPHRTAMRGVRA